MSDKIIFDEYQATLIPRQNGWLYRLECVFEGRWHLIEGFAKTKPEAFNEITKARKEIVNEKR